MHPGANDGYASILVSYPLRGQAVVILTNGDNGKELTREILNSVSVEYGWVKNYTIWYAGIALVFIVLLFLIRRRVIYRRGRN